MTDNATHMGDRAAASLHLLRYQYPPPPPYSYNQSYTLPPIRSEGNVIQETESSL